MRKHRRRSRADAATTIGAVAFCAVITAEIAYWSTRPAASFSNFQLLVLMGGLLLLPLATGMLSFALASSLDRLVHQIKPMAVRERRFLRLVARRSQPVIHGIESELEYDAANRLALTVSIVVVITAILAAYIWLLR